MCTAMISTGQHTLHPVVQVTCMQHINITLNKACRFINPESGEHLDSGITRGVQKNNLKPWLRDIGLQYMQAENTLMSSGH